MKSELKKKYQFITETKVINDKKMPIIVLYDGSQKNYTELEKYCYTNDTTYKYITIYKKIKNICTFLNFVINKSDIKKIEDINPCILKNFYSSFKKRKNGQCRKYNNWLDDISTINLFLLNYKRLNDTLSFSYTEEDLFKDQNIFSEYDGLIQGSFKKQCSLLGIEPPEINENPKITILEDHFELLLDLAMDIDPMIRLPLALQGYAGLRRGEIANLTLGKIKVNDNNVSINLNSEADFVKKINSDLNNKSDFGSIFNHRIVNVYPDLVDDVIEAIDFHINYLNDLGYKLNDDSPLLYNKSGNPLSSFLYSYRVKNLYFSDFIPTLDEYYETMKNTDYYKNTYDIYKSYQSVFPGTRAIRNVLRTYLRKRNPKNNKIIHEYMGDVFLGKTYN